MKRPCHFTLYRGRGEIPYLKDGLYLSQGSVYKAASYQ